VTTRLYYADSHQLTFEATVVARETVGDRPAVVLDETAFYPTSGGQPHDIGTLNEATVLEVVDRDEDGAILHVVDRPLEVGARVRGQIDWTRRLDHMQQHTGQHVLSAAFDRLYGVRTTSFHMGIDSSTIDLAREMTPAEIDAAERLANEVVWGNLAVTIRYASDEEARQLPLRKESGRTGELRLIEIPGVDLSACGGTHVARTGTIGLVAVTGWERFKGGSRVGFVCGNRARVAFDRLRDVTDRATRLLNVPPSELAPSIARLQQDLRTAGKVRQDLAVELAGYRGAAFREAAEPIRDGVRAVLREEPSADGAALKALATAIVAAPGCVAVLVGGGTPAPVVAGRSSDVDWDAASWLKQATARFGGRGGGRPEMAQGGLTAPAADILAFARQAVGVSR
jgi:alanyl-tRNA synthetase